MIHGESAELNTALFASIGHDVMARLTAIQTAASNLKGTWLTAEDRVEQSDVILGEAERIRRLFENILEMVRIDGSPTSPEMRWAVPSEIITAARHQIERTLEHHPIEVAIRDDQPIVLDPRFSANALARLLENAAQYAPAGSPIRIEARQSKGDWAISVSDRGPGIASIDLPHVFDRFYRGKASRHRVSGTGLGLWIVRELLAAQGGRVCAANRLNGGAVFTIVIPTSTSADRLEASHALLSLAEHSMALGALNRVRDAIEDQVGSRIEQDQSSAHESILDVHRKTWQYGEDVGGYR